jgi:hypothetical protein
MTDDSNATRRSFLKGGAILAAPLAIAIPTAAIAADDRAERLKRLEDEAAIRALHRDWLRRVNGSSADIESLFVSAKAARCLDDAVCGIAPDHAEAELIEVAADGKCATGRFVCMVETQNALAPDSTLAQMALAQGGGIMRQSERKLVSADYVKAGARWAISEITLREA